VQTVDSRYMRRKFNQGTPYWEAVLELYLYIGFVRMPNDVGFENFTEIRT